MSRFAPARTGIYTIFHSPSASCKRRSYGSLVAGQSRSHPHSSSTLSGYFRGSACELLLTRRQVIPTRGFHNSVRLSAEVW